MKDNHKMLKMLQEGGKGSEMDGEHADAYRNVLGHLKTFAKGMMADHLKSKGMGAEPKVKGIEVTKIGVGAAPGMSTGDFDMADKTDHDEGMNEADPMEHELASKSINDDSMNEGHMASDNSEHEGHEDPMAKMRMMLKAKGMKA